MVSPETPCTDELRQRRRKTSNVASASSTPGGDAVPGGDQPTPIEQLRGARARLARSRDRMVDLHAAWKRQLFLMSLVIVAMALYQLQTSIATCLREIKDADAAAEAATTGAKAAARACGNSSSEVVGVVVAALLACFLALSLADPRAPMGLERWPYLASSALVPLCLGLYFRTQQQGCAAGDGDRDEAAAAGGEGDVPLRHQFPAVVIYHTIVTIAAWFMRNGIQKAEEHVDLVSDSIRDFERMDKKLALKRQLKGRARGK